MNKTKKIIGKSMIILVLITIICSAVLAIGIRPTRTILKTIPNATDPYYFFIMNDEGRDIDVKVYAEGTLADFVKFERDTYAIGPSGRQLKFTLDLPDEIPPGENVIDIVIEPQELWFKKKTTFTAKLKIIHKVIISGDIPDKYIKAGIDIEEYETYIDIQTNIQNQGRDDIQFLKSRYEITDGQDTIQEFSEPSKQLGRGQAQTFTKKLSIVDFMRGEYQLNVLIDYDDKSLTLSKLFKVGEPDLKVTKWDKYLKFDDINEFLFEVETEWNQEIPDIYAELALYRQGAEIKSARTERFNLLPGEKKKIVNFIDVRGLATGMYDGVLRIHYLDKTIEEKFKVEVLPDEDFERTKEIEASGSLVYVILLVLSINMTAMVIVMVVSMRKRDPPPGYYIKQP